MDRIDRLMHGQFLEPMLRGRYPDRLLEIVDRTAGLGHVRDGDLEIIAQPIDLLGVNYYAPCVVQAQPGEPADPAYPGSENILFTTVPTAVTAMGWAIVPSALTLLLGRLSREYPDLNLMITENGADFADTVTGDGVHDADRVSFIEEHLRALLTAVEEGAKVRGYLVWSLLDCHEWADGYQRRFGLVHVDFATQRRIMKDSALWYRDVIKRGGLGDDRLKRPTLETVAARAHVSRATVSRVINGELSVSADARAKVLLAVKELGYVPNAAARSLVTRRTDTIALVLSAPGQRGDALTAAVVHYVTSVLESAGKRITLMLSDTAESHRRIVQHVEAGLVDGVILLPADDTDPLTERLARTDAPLVLLGKPAVTSLVPYVDVDNVAGAAAATEHLLRQGRRHIGMVCGPTQLVAVQDRLTGHREALQREGLRPHVALAGLDGESARGGDRAAPARRGPPGRDLRQQRRAGRRRPAGGRGDGPAGAGGPRGRGLRRRGRRLLDQPRADHRTRPRRGTGQGAGQAAAVQAGRQADHLGRAACEPGGPRQRLSGPSRRAARRLASKDSPSLEARCPSSAGTRTNPSTPDRSPGSRPPWRTTATSTTCPTGRPAGARSVSWAAGTPPTARSTR